MYCDVECECNKFVMFIYSNIYKLDNIVNCVDFIIIVGA